MRRQAGQGQATWPKQELKPQRTPAAARMLQGRKSAVYNPSLPCPLNFCGCLPGLTPYTREGDPENSSWPHTAGEGGKGVFEHSP